MQEHHYECEKDCGESRGDHRGYQHYDHRQRHHDQGRHDRHDHLYPRAIRPSLE
jgi:hypothetical protein